MENTVEVQAQECQDDAPAVVEKTHALSTEAPETDAPTEKIEVDVAKTEDINKKTVKERKQRAPREKTPKAPSHPPYFQMIKEAITSLNEKAGSSPYAIAKYMQQNHEFVLPSNFRKILGLQLKNSVSKGKLIKIRASYKLSNVGKNNDESPTTATTTKTRAARANAGAKPKETRERRKPKSRVVNKIDNPPLTSQLPSVPSVGGNTRGRRSKRSGHVAKPKQLKSIKTLGVKKANKKGGAS